MSKSLFAAVAVAAVLGLSGSIASAEAPSACAAAAARAADNVSLRIQQSGIGAENRESAKLHLGMASNAAAAGNEAECWRQLRIASLFGATPVFPPSGAGAGAQSGH